MSLKEALKKIPGLQTFMRGCKDLVGDIRVIPNYLAERKIKREGPVRVGFLCQYLPVWHKLVPIYQYMKEDPRFAPMLICVPSNMENSRLVGQDDTKNDTLEYFHAHGFPEAVSALQPDGSWLELQALKLQYVFYPRPYDQFMPPCYHSALVSRYSRICLLFYGINMTKELANTTLNRKFYRNVYCYFAELPSARARNKRRGWLLHLLRLQRSVYYGMPGIEEVLAAKGQESASWRFSKNKFRVMWTPRWTTDKALGGSNFFTYYQKLLDFAGEHPDIDFLFRPHPLALKHFQETGEMTAREAEEFVAACRELPNVSLDAEPEYTATLWQTDALISDASGLIPEYCVTGKPLLFCTTNFEHHWEKTNARLMDGAYQIGQETELFACLLALQRGEDPLREKRTRIHGEIFRDELCYPAKAIAEHLAK